MAQLRTRNFVQIRDLILILDLPPEGLRGSPFLDDQELRLSPKCLGTLTFRGAQPNTRVSIEGSDKIIDSGSPMTAIMKCAGRNNA
jgi:hypothetical protein